MEHWNESLAKVFEFHENNDFWSAIECDSLNSNYIPTNICWSWRRLQDVFPQEMSWSCLQHVFSVTIARLPRRLEDILKTSCKTCWRRLGRRKIVTLKTSSRRLEDMSLGRLEDMSWRRFEDVMETNKILTGDICIWQI